MQQMMGMMTMMRRTSTNFLGFLFRELRGYRFWVVMAIIMAALQTLSDLLLAFPLKIVIDKLASGRDPTFLGGIVGFFDHFGTPAGAQGGGAHTVLGVILFAASLSLLLSLVNSLSTYALNSFSSVVGKNLAVRLRKQLFEQLQRLTLDWHSRQKKGDIVQRITGDVTEVERIVTEGLIEFVPSVLVIICSVIIALLINVPFTLLFMLVIPIMFAVVFAYVKGIAQASKKAAKAAGEVANVASEDVGAIVLIKSFTIEERESMRFARYTSQNREATLRAGELQSQLRPVSTGILGFALAAILAIGAYVAAGHSFTFWFLIIPGDTLTIGSLTVFLAYLAKLYVPMRSISRLTNVGITAAIGAERIQEVFDQAPEMQESDIAYTGPKRLRGEISFQQVAFGYMPGSPVLQGIDLHIPAGRKIGLVGLSGGGKTTLTKLIPRFYEPQQGNVMIDGVDNRSYPLGVLRQNISLVLQESILFGGTIRENIALGRPDASDAEIMQAARQAAIHDTIMSLPQGYDTWVREGGMNFSGGQRQRLAIARAILRDAPILILDEPTASLDVEAEVQITRALDTLIENRTVLVISHRLNTLGNVDEIVVLGDGRIVERGTFEELSQAGGLFSKLLAEQNRYLMSRAKGEAVLRPAEMCDASSGMMSAKKPRRAVAPQAVEKARLLVEVNGKKVGESLLDGKKAVLTVGRLEMNDVVVPARTVSRLHAQLRLTDGTWVMEDAESLNGLMYQGERVEQLPLSHGDRVYLSPSVALEYATVQP